MKFTFKKHKKEGQYRSFQKDMTDIKLNKLIVGLISEYEHGSYRIMFAIKKKKTEDDPAPFKWIRLAKTFINEENARSFIKKHNDTIQVEYNLYQFED